jgi:hypothetical protein
MAMNVHGRGCMDEKYVLFWLRFYWYLFYIVKLIDKWECVKLNELLLFWPMIWLNSLSLQNFNIESEAADIVMYGTFPNCIGVQYVSAIWLLCRDCKETATVEKYSTCYFCLFRELLIFFLLVYFLNLLMLCNMCY